jgi:hypothetical protein
MDLLLILSYVAFCYAVFKVFRIPVNQWTLATAALGGIFGISLLLLVMNYNHPFSTNARIYFATTPVLPGVKGRVVEVPVQTNSPLKTGTCCFASILRRTSTRWTSAARRWRRPSRMSASSRPPMTRHRRS